VSDVLTAFVLIPAIWQIIFLLNFRGWSYVVKALGSRPLISYTNVHSHNLFCCIHSTKPWWCAPCILF